LGFGNKLAKINKSVGCHNYSNFINLVGIKRKEAINIFKTRHNNVMTL